MEIRINNIAENHINYLTDIMINDINDRIHSFELNSHKEWDIVSGLTLKELTDLKDKINMVTPKP